MGAKFLKYGFIAIGIYLVVNSGLSGPVAKEGFSGAANVVKAFQGRG